mgnify:CR=1 FL=1
MSLLLLMLVSYLVLTMVVWVASLILTLAMLFVALGGTIIVLMEVFSASLEFMTCEDSQQT